jgi:hypothetical protein
MEIRFKAERYGIDLNADPVFIPSGFEVLEHLKEGFLEWNPIRPQIELYLAPGQSKGILDGEKVFEGLRGFEGVPVNANALDFFLSHYRQKPIIIPEEWKKLEHYKSKHILFWGTRYRFEGGICVRSLDWNADARVHEWRSGYCWVDNVLNSQYPAAMLRKAATKSQVPSP